VEEKKQMGAKKATTDFLSIKFSQINHLLKIEHITIKITIFAMKSKHCYGNTYTRRHSRGRESPSLLSKKELKLINSNT